MSDTTRVMMRNAIVEQTKVAQDINLKLVAIDAECKRLPEMRVDIKETRDMAAETKRDLRHHFMDHVRGGKYLLALWIAALSALAGVVVFWATHR